jgi:hypothetical protein
MVSAPGDVPESPPTEANFFKQASLVRGTTPARVESIEISRDLVGGIREMFHTLGKELCAPGSRRIHIRQRHTFGSSHPLNSPETESWQIQEKSCNVSRDSPDRTIMGRESSPWHGPRPTHRDDNANSTKRTQDQATGHHGRARIRRNEPSTSTDRIRRNEPKTSTTRVRRNEPKTKPVRTAHPTDRHGRMRNQRNEPKTITGRNRQNEPRDRPTPDRRNEPTCQDGSLPSDPRGSSGRGDHRPPGYSMSICN